MARHLAFAGTVTIPNGTKPSNILVIEQGLLGINLVIESPATLTGTVSLLGSVNDADAPQPVSINGTAQTVPANSVQKYDINGLKQVQLTSGTNEGGDRAFKVYIEVDI